MTLQLFRHVNASISSHFLLSRWSDGEFQRRLDILKIPYSSSWLGMFSRHIDLKNLRMTLHCLSKLPALYRDFLRLIRYFEPDLIYVASYHELILLLPLLRMAKIPVVYHAHSSLPTAHFYKASFALWGGVVEHYLPVSKSVQTSIEVLGVPANKISLFYNSVDLAVFGYRPFRSNYIADRFGWPSENMIIGMTGQMMEGKGHLDFLRAASLLRNEFPNARFVIGGKQDGLYFAALRQQVLALSLEDIVEFSGWQEEMSLFYCGLDIFVFPGTLPGEGFGLVIAEAMATGVPTVVTQVGGAGEVVEADVSGLLIGPHNPYQLADAIRTLIMSPERRFELSKAGRQRVESSFNLAQQALRFEHLVSEIVGANGSS